MLALSALWHPAAPAHALRPGDNVLACTVMGQDLAVWRSTSGQVQAWEDRCPHRGVALSLGRVTGDRLACAYRGWEYAAGSGRCVAIPQLPDIPVPGKVCVRTFATREHHGMVWVTLRPTRPLNQRPTQSQPPGTTSDRWACVRHSTWSTPTCPHTAFRRPRLRCIGRARSPGRSCSADGAHMPIQSRYGYLWVCTGSAAPRPLFALPEYDEPGRRIVDCGGIGVATSGLRVVENFLDMGHFPYIHTGTLGKVPHTEVAPYKVAVDAGSGEIRATECRFFQPRASASAADGIDAQYRYRVMQPFTAALYKSCPNRADALDVIGLFVQPLDDELVIAHCLLVYFEDSLSDADMIGFQHMLFGQDKPILESQRPRRLPLAGALEAHMRCDLTAATYRRWLRQRDMTFGVYQGQDT